MEEKPELGMDVNFALKMFEEFKQIIARKDALLRDAMEMVNHERCIIYEGYPKCPSCDLIDRIHKELSESDSKEQE